MKIQVKQEHINNGARYEPECCPIALAVKEQVKDVPTPLYVNCHKLLTEDSEGKSVTLALLPVEANKFISDFDCNYSVEPFEFDVEFEVAI